MEKYDVIIIGAGAAGLFCAAQAGQRGLRVLVLDNGKTPGRKILMSGGGRCNFTNLSTTAACYLSHNPHFCKSALARFTPWDFLEQVKQNGIAFHEKAAGQLFCDDSSRQIVDMLIRNCEQASVTFRFSQHNVSVARGEAGGWLLSLSGGRVSAAKLVIASGGLSMPKLGASPFGYRVAQQFGLRVLPTRAALVPFTLHKPLLQSLQTLAGVSLPVTLTAENGVQFHDALLFTHRGLSGPAVLQLSSYWQPGETITIDLSPNHVVAEVIEQQRRLHPGQSVKNALSRILPARLVEVLKQLNIVPSLTLKQLSSHQQQVLANALHQWRLQPNGTEGYRTAEVTLGGVDTTQLSSKTMEARSVPGLYFIGEVVDVTGWLGGYNFQWAWSSAWACAQAL